MNPVTSKPGGRRAFQCGKVHKNSNSVWNRIAKTKEPNIFAFQFVTLSKVISKKKIFIPIFPSKRLRYSYLWFNKDIRKTAICDCEKYFD